MSPSRDIFDCLVERGPGILVNTFQAQDSPRPWVTLLYPSQHPFQHDSFRFLPGICSASLQMPPLPGISISGTASWNLGRFCLKIPAASFSSFCPYMNRCWQNLGLLAQGPPDYSPSCITVFQSGPQSWSFFSDLRDTQTQLTSSEP